MKKYFRLMLAGALALVMILSLASCAKLEMDDVEDALEEYAEDNEDECTFSDLKDEMGKDALIAGFEECGKIKGDVEACFEFANIEDEEDPTAWCMIVEFEEAADAKTVEKEIEDKLEDFMLAVLMAMATEDVDEDELEEYEEMFKELMEAEVEAGIPSKVAVERKGNIVFFGEKKTVESVLEIIEDAK